MPTVTSLNQQIDELLAEIDELKSQQDLFFEAEDIPAAYNAVATFGCMLGDLNVSGDCLWAATNKQGRLIAKTLGDYGLIANARAVRDVGSGIISADWLKVIRNP